MGKVGAQLGHGTWLRQRYQESDLEPGTAEYEASIHNGNEKGVNNIVFHIDTLQQCYIFDDTSQKHSTLFCIIDNAVQ
jgi:hypothetical protein